MIENFQRDGTIREKYNVVTRSSESQVAAGYQANVIGFGWSPHWHRATDVFTTYSDKDFRLGLNAAQTTLAGVAQLAGARLSK